MRRSLVLAAALVAGCGAQERSDWERQNEARQEKEESTPVPKPPPFPKRENYVQFEVPGPPTQGFRYFIDAASLQVGAEKQRLIQYVVVARSPSGVENVAFEGLRCATAEFRTYAYGQADGTWAGRPSGWRSITSPGARPWNVALMRDYFCPQAVPVRSADEALRALRQGGNPFSKGFSGDALLGK